MYSLEGSLLWQKNGRAFFLEKKQPVIAEKQTFFSKTLKLSQVFAQLSI
jgi:CHASE1-domain containing sensor protein